ncbi:hypothetical protein BGX29_006208 [Mortierella sp. GBA35]|nr:hypothetical protein BGX29_006208 [Mortierella sp. GBA35]
MAAPVAEAPASEAPMLKGFIIALFIVATAMAAPITEITASEAPISEENDMLKGHIIALLMVAAAMAAPVTESPAIEVPAAAVEAPAIAAPDAEALFRHVLLYAARQLAISLHSPPLFPQQLELAIHMRRIILERAAKSDYGVPARDGITDSQGSSDESKIRDFESTLRTLRTQRIRKHENAIFIPPFAKPGIQASNDTLFPLMDKVPEFLAGDAQVMLILGDSGSGKSTVSLNLEYELWEE